MKPEHPTSDNDRRPASGPKKAIARKRTARRRAKQRNALYQLATEFRRRHPQATAAAAWAHFIAVAATGCHDVVLRHDAARDALEYAPDPGRRSVRTIKLQSFERQYRALKEV